MPAMNDDDCVVLMHSEPECQRDDPKPAVTVSRDSTPTQLKCRSRSAALAHAFHWLFNVQLDLPGCYCHGTVMKF